MWPIPCRCQRQSGFTLIELIVTLILIGILAVLALPRLFDKGGYEEVALRDELVNRLRLVQQASMNAPSGCEYLLTITATAITVTVSNGVCSDIAQTTALGTLLVTPATIAFDHLGRPGPQGELCDGGCDLTITGSETQTVRIESEGFIHAL